MTKKYYTLILCILTFSLLSGVSNAQNTKIIQWDSVGQKITIPKSQDFEFQYNFTITPCHKVIMTERGKNQTFTMITECVKSPDITQLPPDTLFVQCDGEILRAFKEDKANSDKISRKSVRKEKIIKWKAFGQVEKVENCELVTFIYSNNIQPEDVDFVYEQVSDGYLLTLKMLGQITELNFDCICKRFEVANPYSYRMNIDPRLKYEQLIMTPMRNNLWEVRIGTTHERKCKSPARTDLSLKRTQEYEKEMPKICK